MKDGKTDRRAHRDVTLPIYDSSYWSDGRVLQLLAYLNWKETGDTVLDVSKQQKC